MPHFTKPAQTSIPAISLTYDIEMVTNFPHWEDIWDHRKGALDAVTCQYVGKLLDLARPFGEARYVCNRSKPSLVAPRIGGSRGPATNDGGLGPGRRSTQLQFFVVGSAFESANVD